MGVVQPPHKTKEKKKKKMLRVWPLEVAEPPLGQMGPRLVGVISATPILLFGVETNHAGGSSRPSFFLTIFFSIFNIFYSLNLILIFF
jgi:hypothetical protein